MATWTPPGDQASYDAMVAYMRNEINAGHLNLGDTFVMLQRAQYNAQINNVAAQGAAHATAEAT
jgi:hypothetical protein